MGYPSREDEKNVLLTHREGEPVDKLEPVVDCAQITSLQNGVRQVTVDEAIYDYLLDIVEATRNSPEISMGVSTRGALSLYRAAQASALIEERDYVIPDDVKRLAVAVLAHRIVVKGVIHGSQREMVEEIVQRIVEETPVPE